jgi:thiosulfate/3-mercaptopyruvate sulfurtransferase
MMKSALLLLMTMILAACASTEVRSKTNTARRNSIAPVAGLPDIEFADATVVIDARPSFVFGFEHIPRAINLQWDDFSQAEPSQKGVLQSDLFSVARRLARLGISPESKVIVVGRGLHGIGEEGRIAWMLAYLGVSRVSMIDIQAVKGKLLHTDLSGTTAEGKPEAKYDENLTDQDKADRARRAAEESAPDVRAVAMWKPELDDSLLATRAELLAVVARNGVRQPLAWEGRAPVIYRVLDVRTPAAYAGKGETAVKTPNLDAINIEWKEFITPQGRPNLKLKARLQKVGILTNQRLIVVHDQGVASAEVVMALRAMGYTNVANFAGGWNDLLSNRNEAGTPVE